MRTVGGLIALLFLSMLGAFVFTVVSYWLGGLAYDAGLWPVGTLLRIAALLTIVGGGFYVLIVVGALFVALARRGE